MEVKDLTFVETQLIPPIEKIVPEVLKFCSELVQNALDAEAVKAAAEEAKAKGEAGLAKVTKKPPTRPISPKITQPRPPIMPEPERIEQDVRAVPVPAHLNNITLAKIDEQQKERKNKVTESTIAQYTPDALFKFQEKSNKYHDFEATKKELEAKELSVLNFNASYYNPPPNFQLSSGARSPSKENVSAILREDFLYRKQQAKDAQILKNYEEELRDPIEYYAWQTVMRSQDETEKLKQVALRRDQAKQSADEAKLALEKQKEDNLLVGNMIREQNELIKQQKIIENQIDLIAKQDIVQQIINVRETKPVEAKQAVVEVRIEEGKKLREQLEIIRQQKAEEEAAEELIKADRIRQQRALNTVHREHIKVFDPTEIVAQGSFLDEMSYMEMKVRLDQVAIKEEEARVRKLQEIEEEKTKKMSDLERRKASILHARKLKRESAVQIRSEKHRMVQEKEEEAKRIQEQATQLWEEELRKRQERKQQEQDALLAEQEKIKRQQQYLGVAQGQVAQIREQQMSMARARQMAIFEKEYLAQQEASGIVVEKESVNKQVLYRQTAFVQEKKLKESEAAAVFEKTASLQKLKNEILYKKSMFQVGQDQHDRTKTKLQETNPYGFRISQDLRTLASTSAKGTR